LATALEACGFSPTEGLGARLLAAAASVRGEDEIESAVHAAVDHARSGESYSTVAAAIENRQALEIVYQGAGRESGGRRVVEPHGLANHRGAWYFSAWCRSAQAVRTFRLDRVISALSTGESFERPPDARPPGLEFAADPRLPVAEVVFGPGTRVPDAREWPFATHTACDDGSVVVRVPYASSEWLARQVVARLGDAVVRSPDSVRHAVRTVADSTASSLRQ
jgi:proteasome accessory factor C